MFLRRGVPMTRTGLITAAVIVIILCTPFASLADYLYTGTAELQPLAVIEPATPDSLFSTWTGDIELNGRKNLGFSLDFLRYQEDSADWDEIFAATGSFRSGEKLLFGITVPFIIRDSEFNESGPLDLRLFARMRLLGKAPSFRVSGELSTILPTARKDTVFPFSLESPVVGARLAFAGGSAGLRAGVNVGYQTYLETESGNDTDELFGAWLEKDLQGPWKIAGVYSSSKHKHTGSPGDDDITDSNLQVGIRRVHSERTDFGLALGSGISGDSAADLRIMATATFRFGKVKAAKEERKVIKEKQKIEQKQKVEKKEAVEIRKTPTASVYSGPVVVMIAEGVAGKKTEKIVTKALQKSGFATGMDPDPGVKVPRKNVLWYNPGMQGQAIKVSRTLIMGGYLKDLEIKENKKPMTQNWMLLLLGGEKK